MRSCKDTLKIISSSQDLSIFQKMELKMHLLMCKHCLVYMKHLKMVKDGVKSLLFHKSKSQDETVKKIEDQVIEKFRHNG